MPFVRIVSFDQAGIGYMHIVERQVAYKNRGLSLYKPQPIFGGVSYAKYRYCSQDMRGFYCDSIQYCI
jgi:hypothetical protein